MFLPDQSHEFFGEGSEARPISVYCNFLEVWDTEKDRLLKL